MPIRDSYAQGTPNWVDLQTSDQAAAKAFYAALFGWTAAEQGGTVAVPPFDTPVGRIAVLGDPQGAVFSVIKSA